MSTAKSFRRDRVPDTFAARQLKTPRQQKTVDSLGEFAENEVYGVELNRKRRKRTQYLII